MDSCVVVVVVLLLIFIFINLIFIILIIIIITTTTIIIIIIIIITIILLIKAGTAGACLPSSAGKAISVYEALPLCTPITKALHRSLLGLSPAATVTWDAACRHFHPTDNWLMMSVTSDMACGRRLRQ